MSGSPCALEPAAPAPPRRRLIFGIISLYVIENNGVRFISAMLRQQGWEVVEVYLKDYYHARFVWPTEQELDNVVKVLRERRVDLVGISLRAGGYFRLCKELTRKLKRELGIPVIWGGMHVTMDPEQCIRETDMVVVGEAEHVMVELLSRMERGEDYSDVPSLWINRGDGDIVRNPTRPLEEDLDVLPFRDFHSHRDKYWVDGKGIKRGDPYAGQTAYLLISARGCLFNCAFCDINALRKVYEGKGKFYRVMSPGRVVEECRYALATFPNLRRFRFDDELFCMTPAWVDEFCSLYKREIGLPFELLTDPRVVVEGTLAKLKDAGLDTVMMGIQNLDRINKRYYNRPVSNRRVLEAARILHRLKLKPCYQILMDDPHCTSQDKQDFFDFLSRLPRPFDLYLFSLSYWPNTDITLNYLAEGLITEDDVEGRNDKCLKQFRVDLSWPRPAEDVFWHSVITLLSKSVVPLCFVRWLSRREWLKRHPWPVFALAQFLNAAKLGWLGIQMLFKGELTVDTLKRWVNWKSLATS